MMKRENGKGKMEKGRASALADLFPFSIFLFPAARARASARQKGFTLIELLVAMALVAMLMTMVYEGLRTGD